MCVLALFMRDLFTIHTKQQYSIFHIHVFVDFFWIFAVFAVFAHRQPAINKLQFYQLLRIHLLAYN